MESPACNHRSITQRQMEVLAYIAARLKRVVPAKEPTTSGLTFFYLVEGTPPTLQEIADWFGIRAGQGVMCHLNALCQKGLLERDPEIARGMRLTQAGERALAARQMEVRLG